jgi:DMSO/TMAO reductase YedYZ molybdopterin-dependent catalytic subunit
LKAILERAGLYRNATTVNVGATDGYVIDFLFGDVLENPESPDPFILAYKVDGEYLPVLEGPYRLITPDADYTEDDGHNWYHQTWIKTVAHITVQTSGTPAPPLPWGSPADGMLNITWTGGYHLYTSSELASMWSDIVSINATMVNKVGIRTTNTYSGIPLLHLTELAGAPSWAGNITLVSSDGYSKSMDPMEVYLREAEEDNVTLVAMTEGGSWLSAEKGPFRLVGSAYPSSYWISQLSKIEVRSWEFMVNGTPQIIDSLISLPKVDRSAVMKGKMMNYS